MCGARHRTRTLSVARSPRESTSSTSSTTSWSKYAPVSTDGLNTTQVPLRSYASSSVGSSPCWIVASPRLAPSGVDIRKVIRGLSGSAASDGSPGTRLPARTESGIM